MITDDINDVKIEYQGKMQTIGHMLNDLENGRAAYWYWHTLLYETISLYEKVSVSEPYGILLHLPLTIDKKTCFDIEGAISQGGYDKDWLIKMVKIYAFLRQTELSKNTEGEGAI